MTTTTTLTGQQRAVATLAAILATAPDLPAATWTIWPDRLSSAEGELHGQLDAQAIADLRHAIDGYFLAFNLRLDEDKFMPGNDYCEAFTEVSTSGVIGGVKVKVWGAGR